MHADSCINPDRLSLRFIVIYIGYRLRTRRVKLLIKRTSWPYKDVLFSLWTILRCVCVYYFVDCQSDRSRHYLSVIDFDLMCDVDWSKTMLHLSHDTFDPRIFMKIVCNLWLATSVRFTCVPYLDLFL